MEPSAHGHRGPHPEDAILFAAARVPALQRAVQDLAWLLGRGYSINASLKLVGDRFALTDRQRKAVGRAVCSPSQQFNRQIRRLSRESLRGQALAIDGFNVLITVEVALAGGVLLRCADGCLRDMASVHGTYRSVRETATAITEIGRWLTDAGVGRVTWFLDQPISNSGRLAQEVRAIAAAHDWSWHVEIVRDPDAILREAAELVASSDSIILDAPIRWCNLADHIVGDRVPSAWIVDLSGASPL